MITVKQFTDASFSFTNSAGSGAGSWAPVSDIGASNGAYNATSVLGDKFTHTWFGTDLYMYIGTGQNGADFTVTTDGVTRNSIQTCNSDKSIVPPMYLRVPVAIERGLTNGSHTTVIQGTNSLGGTGTSLYINTAFWVDNNKLVPGLSGGYRTLGCAGDSWTFGTGSLETNVRYTNLLQRALFENNGVDYLLNNVGVSGSGTITTPTINLASFFDQAVTLLTTSTATVPSIFTFMFGINDVYYNKYFEFPSQVVKNIRTTLNFISDSTAVSGTTTGNFVNVVAATPGWIAPYFKQVLSQTSGSTAGSGTNYMYGYLAYDTILQQQLRSLFREFPWLGIADVYKSMDRNSGLIQPNGQDTGLHPNNAGHWLISDVFYRAINVLN